MPKIQFIEGECLQRLKEMPDASVHCCVTSPPYWGLRDYGTAAWKGGDQTCDHVDMAIGMSTRNTLGPSGHLHESNAANVGRIRQYRDVCGKCGAIRVDRQIGLEQTPEEYVAKMVDVFREVRRVLRDDGTLWLNLGDSYVHTGLPAKNLVGIPWRVAFALQQPYYDGRVKRAEDRIWLAAMIDGEGCFYIHRRKAGQHAGDGYLRTQDTYSAAFEVSNTHKAIIDRCMEIAGVGSVICQEKDRRQPLWRWTVRAAEARALAREIYPHLVAKQQQCRIVCGMPSIGPKAEAAWEAMKLLHGGSQTTVDFPAPETCFQPGYYLRQDLIWSKPNPMPESVRDRCTKAHEYVFLLTKSQRYYYDAEAVKESSVTPAEMQVAKRNKVPHKGQRDAGMRETTGGFDKITRLYEMRNRRSVWTITTKLYKEAHFAVMPPDLAKPCILAGCPVDGTVLDPFSGAGTTALVAVQNQRNAIGIELNPEYIKLAQERLRPFLEQESLF
jgi:DNA modification methylase